MSDFEIQAPDRNNKVEEYSNPVTFSFARREVTMLSVTESELDSVASLSNSVHLAFLGISGGAFVTLAVTLATIPVATPAAFAGFVAATIVSGIGTLFFGIRARIAFKEAQQKLREIKRITPSI